MTDELMAGLNTAKFKANSAVLKISHIKQVLLYKHLHYCQFHIIRLFTESSEFMVRESSGSNTSTLKSSPAGVSQYFCQSSQIITKLTMM